MMEVIANNEFKKQKRQICKSYKAKYNINQHITLHYKKMLQIIKING